MSWWVYAVLGAVFAAVTNILIKVGLKGVNSDYATAFRTIIVLVLAWGIVFARGEYTAVGKLPRNSMIFLVLSGVATGLSWIFSYRALQMTKVGLANAIDKSSLAIAVLLAWIFLKEQLNTQSWIGVSLIIIGIFVVALAKS